MHSSEAGITETANSWSRTLGMTLRPWSGYSPLSLILRGAVQIAIGIFFLVFAMRLLSPDEDNAQALRYLSGTAVIVLVSAAIVALLGAVRIVIGVLDLLTSRTVVGTVMSMSDRRFLDFLPEQLEHVIFARGQALIAAGFAPKSSCPPPVGSGNGRCESERCARACAPEPRFVSP